MRTPSRAWVEIDLGAVVGNVRAIRTFVGTGVRVMAVVKADAYGHGAAQVARAIHAAEPDCWFGVATLDEAAMVRAACPSANIVVLSPTLPEDAASVVETGAIPVISDARSVANFAEAAQRRGTSLAVHIEIDSGMGRNGVLPAEATAVVESIRASGVLHVDGIMTHFADAEGDPEGTRHQLDTFLRALHEVGPVLDAGVLRHACNTAAMMLYPDAWMDMVRPGLAVYGLTPQVAGDTPAPALKPALALRARVLLVRRLQKGTRLSYGGTYTLSRDSLVAVIGLGYADGYPWHLSNRGWVLVRGKRVPLVGRVCMDVCLADVTDVGDVQPGETATFIGCDGDECISAEELARTLGTTEHEITSRLGPRLPRVYRGGVLESD